MATVFPSDEPVLNGRLFRVPPRRVRVNYALASIGQPFSMQEYYARLVCRSARSFRWPPQRSLMICESSCHKNGSLTLLFLPISRHSRNIQRSPNHHASLSITSEIPAAAHARVSLIGNVIVYQDARTMPNVDDIKRCYLEKHPDARWWLPDDERAAHLVSIL
ncbi:hypothetical protein AX16_005207 [Volvariella volvacea WC 439]|nr:hypothetical protein AX16_005207 [Volvariella volvacea WC 439]